MKTKSLKRLCLIGVIGLAMIGLGQTQDEGRRRIIIKMKTRACGFGEKDDKVFEAGESLRTVKATPKAMAIFEKILAPTGVPTRKFEFAEAGVEEAQALRLPEQESAPRMILFNPEFLDRAAQNTAASWEAKGVIAHELGHHFYDHALTRNAKNPVADELEADNWSGWALRKLGATTEQAQAAVAKRGAEKETATHPKRADRMFEVYRGWRQANEEMEKNGGGGTPREETPPPEEAKKPEPVPAPPAAAGEYPKVEGFTYLRKESFSCGGKSYSVAVYRCEKFAQALGLGSGAKDPACEFILVPAGTFNIGSPASEANHESDESPQQRVTLKRFFMARTEVTQKVWTAIMGNNPAHFKGDDKPVEQVSFTDATEFCVKVGLKLPSEAEWEYACRAGTTTRLAAGDGDSDLDGIGWYGGNAGGSSQPVGGKAANGFGLYDMHGNVWEWCRDGYIDSYNEAPSGNIPRGESASFRVNRGGGWDSGAENARSANRDGSDPGGRLNNMGFRCARVSP